MLGKDGANLDMIIDRRKYKGFSAVYGQQLAETGQISTRLEETVPARMITNPQIFPSLLFYYGMLTIKGTFGSQLVLGIPNNNVRKQYYGYLLEEYQDDRYEP